MTDEPEEPHIPLEPFPVHRPDSPFPPLGESVAAPVHLLITGVFALANWPADWRDLLPAGLRPRALGARVRPVAPSVVQHRV